VALDGFYHDYQVNDLEPGEFVERIRLPLPEGGTELYAYKLSKRFDQDISSACMAALVGLDDECVATIRIACGGLAATVRRATHCEAALAGQAWNEVTIDKGMAALARDFQPISDMRASAEYRLRASQNLLRRLYLESRGELGASVYTYGRQD
jgi:xanthine dehydrogenase small subunit